MDLFGDFTTAGLIANLLFSTLGLWFFQQSRKKMNVKLSIIGVVMMLFPFFVSNAWGEWALGLGLCGAGWWIWDEE